MDAQDDLALMFSDHSARLKRSQCDAQSLQAILHPKDAHWVKFKLALARHHS